MKNILALITVLAVALGFATACDFIDNISELIKEPALIGVSMPNQTTARWMKDGETMEEILVGRGYEVDLRYAGDSIPAQIRQIEEMLDNGAKVLVIAAIDGAALSDVLDKAAEDGAFIIAYDRLIMGTTAVSYYATFDNVKVGELQATSLVSAMKATKDRRQYSIELFAGSPDDSNAPFLFSGAMSVLQPLIDSGEVRVFSGQTALEDVRTPRWDIATAEARMDAILAEFYRDGKPLDGVLAPNDNIARGVIAAFHTFGFHPGADNWPIVTGQDAEAASIKLIITGEQHSTILKDTRDLARVAADMVEAVLEGREPVINDATTYDNNVKVVPTYLLVPYTVHADNYKQLIIDSGYMTEDDIE